MHGAGDEGESQAQGWICKRQGPARAWVPEGGRARPEDAVRIGHEPSGEGGLIDEHAVGPAAHRDPHRGEGFVAEERRTIAVAEERVEPGESIGGGDRPKRRKGSGTYGWRVHRRGAEQSARFAQGTPGERGAVYEGPRERAWRWWCLWGDDVGCGFDPFRWQSEPEIEAERSSKDPFPEGTERLAGHASDDLVEQEAEGAGAVSMAAIGRPVRRLRSQRGRHCFMIRDRESCLVDRGEAGLVGEQQRERERVLSSGGELRP